MLFDARKTIREKLQGGHDPQPAKLADAIAEECPEEYLRLALSQALPYLVRDEIRKVRHAALGRRGTKGGATRGMEAYEQVAKENPKDPALKPSEGARAQGGTLAFSIFQVPVSLGVGYWKYLGECTREEILEAGQHLERRAQENQSRADGYKALAEAMEEAGADKVSDLDGEQVRDLVKPEEEPVAA
jgi:hypothetical protein